MTGREASRKIPLTTIRRLSAYYRVLTHEELQSQQAVSSEDLSGLTGFSAAQVRRDMAYFGTFGKRGVGYSVALLRSELARILGIDRGWRLGLVGVGNLGRALLAYRGFADQGFEIVAAFDVDSAKVGTTAGGVDIHEVARLDEIARTGGIDIALLAVPASAAQAVADIAVQAGVRAILNFAPVQLRVPEHVHLSNVDLSMEVEYLSYSLTH